MASTSNNILMMKNGLNNKKPVGAVQLRRNHPLASRVLAAYVFNDHHQFDDVSGNHIKVEAMNSPVIGELGGIRGLKLDGVNQHLRISYEYELLSNLDGFTICGRSYETSGDGMIFSIVGPTAASTDLQIYSGTSLYRFWGYNGVGTGGVAYTSGINSTVIDFVAVQDDIGNANTRNFYTKKSGAHTTTTETTSIASVTDTRWLLIGTDGDTTVGNGYSSLGNYFAGVIGHLYFIRGVLTPHEARELIDSPYSILESVKAARVYHFLAGSVSGVTNPKGVFNNPFYGPFGGPI